MALDSTLTRQDNLMPQRTGGMGRGTAMALLVHLGLLIALAFGVKWRSQTPAGVSAELWAAVPQIAAPQAGAPKPAPTPTPVPTPAPAPPPPTPKAEEPPPKPAPNEAEIAIEKEKAERKLREQQEREQQERLRKEQEREQQERLRKEQERKEQERKEQERIEREKAEKLAAQKQRELEIKRAKEEEARQAKQREENLKRILGQAAGTGAPNSPGTAAREAGPSASYAGRIVARVKPNIFLTDEVPGNPSADVEVRCASDGKIVGRRIVKSSGNREWDEAVIRALDRTEVLPRDTDGSVPSSMVITFRPRE
ncbi:MAG TPA: cell envelope integrity protein TolA [Burkholderiaceae bacterium]|nr:cell envelope integrity protein TolA [Burkholderiaceae bacterium]